MIGLITAIIIFNFIAFKTNRRLTSNQIFHIWAFTIAFQCIFDVIVEFKYHGYWYFGKEVEWADVLPRILLIPPVNMMFLIWYPFKTKIIKQIFYFIIWVIAILIYESITLLPEPWGYFHYRWWKLWHAAIINPILFIILLGYYKLVCKAEKKLKLGDTA